jgi:NTP pyrophosphatase (non-canonical NTP hydrolase)
MTFDEYQEAAGTTAAYPDRGNNLLYPALGLAGESGEAVDKIKKLWRNKGITGAAKLEPADRDELVKEIGDVLWYVAALASELKVSMGEVAERNIAKLADRKARNVIHSEGDNR